MNPKLVMTGWAMSMLVILFLLIASVAPKLVGATVATESLRSLGWDPRHMLLIGLIELTCVILYAVPRTSVLGAIVTTGLLGGAIATQVRATPCSGFISVCSCGADSGSEILLSERYSPLETGSTRR